MPVEAGSVLDAVAESEDSAIHSLKSRSRPPPARAAAGSRKLDLQTNMFSDLELQELSMLPSPQLSAADVFEIFSGATSTGMPVMRAPSTSRRWPVTPAARLLHFHAAGNHSPRERGINSSVSEPESLASTSNFAPPLRPGIGERKSSYSSSVAEARTPTSRQSGFANMSPHSPGQEDLQQLRYQFDDSSDNEMPCSPERLDISLPKRGEPFRLPATQTGDISDMSLGSPMDSGSAANPQYQQYQQYQQQLQQLPQQPVVQLARETSSMLHREVRRHLLADSPASESYGNGFSNMRISPEVAEAINRKFADKEDVFIAFDSQLRRGTWDRIRMLGKGSFSKVILATPALSHVHSARLEEAAHSVVAVKITELGKPGSHQRLLLEEALRRDVELAKRMAHPSLVSLIAFNIDTERALMVMPYCQGGDMFDLVLRHRKDLSAMLVQRLFADIVSAVAYLHANNVVHRDIKLENVLIDLTHENLLALQHPEKYPYSLAIVTDLGLARDFDPENPLLTNRCGSEDYVPPELLLGKPYDGRQSDTWALGVLLYATLEGRLPFDAPPGSRPDGPRARMRIVTRIARVDWKWYKRADPGPEWDFLKGVVRDCLKKREDGRILATTIAHMPETVASRPTSVSSSHDVANHMSLFRDD